MSDHGSPAYPIESVDRALSVLLAFEETDSLTITELGRQLDVSRSTAYRLLNLLEHRGFVRQDPQTKAFHAGPALLRIGLAAVRTSDVRAALRPLLEQVAKDVGETTHLIVLQAGSVFFIDCVEGSRIVRATARVGTLLPAHVTAGGKVLLAYLPPPRLDAMLGGGLVKLTSKSTVSATALRRELVAVRKRGWAVNDGESEEGLRAVAVRVDASHSGASMDAAITVAGPAERLDDARLAEIAATLRGAVGARYPSVD